MSTAPHTSHDRRLDAEPAQRILEAARVLVAEHGIAQTHVGAIAEEAGLSRGLVRYYFGSKDGLLADVLAADGTEREAVLRRRLEPAGTLDEVVAALGAGLSQDRAGQLVSMEFGSLALRNAEISRQRAELSVRYRALLAELLAEKAAAGVIALAAEEAEPVAAALIAVGQGLAAEALADPEWDREPAQRIAERAARALLSR